MNDAPTIDYAEGGYRKRRKRMNWWLRHLRPTTILCLGAVVGLTFFWARSRYVADSVGYTWHRNDQSDEWRFVVSLERGQLMLAFFRYTPDYYLSPFSKIRRAAGFWSGSWKLHSASGKFWSKWFINEAWSGNRELGVIIPFWLLIVLFLGVLLARFVHDARSSSPRSQPIGDASRIF